MPKPRPRGKPGGSDQAKQRARSPTQSFTWTRLDGKKQTYDIVSDNRVGDTKNAFLTLHFPSIPYKTTYKASAEHHGWPLLKKIVEHEHDGPTKGSKDQEPKLAVSREGLSSARPFASEAFQQSLRDFDLVEPVHSEAAVSPSKYVQPRTVEERCSRSGQGRSLFPVDPEVAKKEVEGLLSSVSQSFDTASESALDTFLIESTAKKLSHIPGAGLSRPSPDRRAPQTPLNHLVATKAQIRQVDSITKRLQRPLRVDTGQAVNASDSLTQGDKQNQHRGLKRSRTPEPPSLTSGAPSAPETPDSSRSRSNSLLSFPARPRGRPPKAQVPSSFAPPQKIVTFNTQKLPHGWFLDPITMAPVRDSSDVSNKIKDVIQNLYDVQSQTHGFVPETQSLLIDKMAELTQSLSDLQRLTDRNTSPSNPVHNIDLAPEIVDYVDDGRNPDIFTRDFVELVQRGNAVVNGKMQAFRNFSQVYARALKEGIGGVDRGVNMVMDNAGIELDDGGKGHTEKENGEKG